MTSRLLKETLDSLAEAVVTAEIQQRFLSLDPAELLTEHAGVIEERAELLGLLEVTDADLEALAEVIDNARVEVAILPEVAR